MATYTSYLNLEKPNTSETFNLLKMNSNWDKIDNGVSALNSNIGNIFGGYTDVTGTTSGTGSLPLDSANPSFGTNSIITSAQVIDENLDCIVLIVRSKTGYWYAKVLNWDLTPVSNQQVTIRVFGIRR